MRAWLMAAVLAAVWIATARADVLPEGHKSVGSDEYVDNFADFPDYVFYVSAYNEHWTPRMGRPCWVLLGEQGKVVQTSWSSGERTAYLYAIPKALADNVKSDQERMPWFAGQTAGVLKSTGPFRGYDTLPVYNPVARYVTHYRATIAAGKLVLKVVSHQNLDSLGIEVPEWRQRAGIFGMLSGAAWAVVAAAMAALVSLVVIWRRRKASNTTGAAS